MINWNHEIEIPIWILIVIAFVLGALFGGIFL